MTLTALLLVLASWILFAGIVTSAGLLMSFFLCSGDSLRQCVASAVWWGLGLLVALILAISLLIPLRSSSAAFIFFASWLGVAFPGLWLFQRRIRLSRKQLHLSGLRLLPPLSLGLAITYLAFMATGPATNYDTGLYHYGMIRYAGDYGTVNGLANLFVPFCYASAQFPTAALLMNGPWGIEGWRLLNGLVFLLVVLELVLRISNRRWSWGTLVLLVGVGAVSLPLIGMADGLMTSPTADTSVLLLSLISGAYFCDILQDSRNPTARLSVIVVTSALAVAIRPTMLVFSISTVVAAITFLTWKRQLRDLRPRFWAATCSWLSVVGGLQIAKDYHLSGWLIYPLSLWHWDVPWLSRDPVYLRQATLAAARNPLDPDGYQVATSWNWIVPWIERLPSQWEFWFLLVGFLVSTISLVWVRHLRTAQLSIGLLFVALLPLTLATATWFLVSPPSFRFAWGPLILIPLVLIGWSGLHALDQVTLQKSVLIGVTFLVLGVTTYSSVFRNHAQERSEIGNFEIGSVNMRYTLAPLRDVPTTDREMRSGLIVKEPITGEQCWSNYPLCTYSMGDGIALYGDTIASGFVTEN